MKECCKTGDEMPKNKFSQYFKWLIYLVLAGIIIFALVRSL
ncbi:MAG: hypothetical protein Q7W13_00355 [Bacteroidia bacterium]|nr:hypothetical protein [Bacteroidia bacterium]